MFTSQSVTVTSKGQPVTIHMVSCGAVAVKTRFKHARFSGFLAMLDFITDRNFTEWLPIWVMIVEHSEGVYIFDAGEISDINNQDYFTPCGRIAKWFDTTQFKFKVSREDEIDQQLQRLNIPVEKVKAVILTHLHFDHSDGIKYFPSTPVMVSKDEWAKPFGDLPQLYPAWFKPVLLNMNERYDVFDKACYVTNAKDIVLVETPGHTYHHCSVLLSMDGLHIMFAADVCYTQQQLLQGGYPGNNTSNKTAGHTYNKIKIFVSKHPTVFLPSHDEGAANRLKQLFVMP